MEGRKLALLLLGALILAVAGIFALGLTGGGRTEAPLPSSPGSAASDGSGPSKGGADAGLGDWDGGKLSETIADRRVRDELRRRILEQWVAEATNREEAEALAREGKFPPAPAGDGEAMSPEYIQSVFREDMFPMARACYEELLSRKPDAGGTVELSFTIAGDEDIGGIVEDAHVDADGGVADERMSTCMRESLTTLAFRPPANAGVVTVVYPIVFNTDEDTGEAPHDSARAGEGERR